MNNVLKYDVIKPKGITIKLPVIFLHGIYGCRANMRHIADSPLIHSERSTYLLDLRNHGDSFHKNDMHFKSMTEDVIHFMNMVGINRAVWIGHSYGAKIGMYAALNYPDYVSSLIALDIAPVSYESKISQFSATLNLFKTMESIKWKNRNDVEQFVSNKMPSLSIEEIQFLTKPFVPIDSGFDDQDIDIEQEWHWKTNIDAMLSEMNNIVAFPVDANAKYDGPSYLFRGELSKWADSLHESTIYQRFPKMKICTVQDAGHNLHIDQPDIMIQHIANCLDEIDIDFGNADGLN